MSKVGDLARAQAYRVDTHDGRIGSIAAVLPRAGGEPEEAGHHGSRDPIVVRT